MRALHVGLRVTDPDRSIGFYRALGYEVVGTVADTPIGHLTMLKLPDDEFVSLELVFDPSQRPGPTASRLSHLVVATESLDDVIAGLRAKGIDAEGMSPPAGSDVISTCRITDPDGTSIELVQWPAGHPAGMTAEDFAHDERPPATDQDR